MPTLCPNWGWLQGNPGTHDWIDPEAGLPGVDGTDGTDGAKGDNGQNG